MVLDSQIKEAHQPYTYRQWFHDCIDISDAELDAMTEEELTALVRKCEDMGEGSSGEWDGTH